MAGTVAHTAEEATVRELRRAALRLLFMLAALALVVVPLLGELPLGMSSQTGLLAWLLVVLGFYWLYAGLGYRPLLLAQLLGIVPRGALERWLGFGGWYLLIRAIKAPETETSWAITTELPP